MKTIRTAFATVAIGASLTLAACSTGEPDAPQEGNNQGQEQGQDQGQGSGEDQAQNSTYTKEQVEKAFKDAGYEVQANAQPPTMKNLEQAKIEPAECKGVLLNQVQRIDETTSDKTIVGTKGQEAAASGVVYGSEDEAKKELANSKDGISKCSTITMDVGGQKLTVTTETKDGSVDGADEALVMSMELTDIGSGPISTVTTRKGNVLVSGTTLGTGSTGGGSDDAEMSKEVQTILEKLG